MCWVYSVQQVCSKAAGVRISADMASGSGGMCSHTSPFTKSLALQITFDQTTFPDGKISKSSNAAAIFLPLNPMIVLCYTNTQVTVTSAPLKTKDEVWKMRGEYCGGKCTAKMLISPMRCAFTCCDSPSVHPISASVSTYLFQPAEPQLCACEQCPGRQGLFL